MKKYVVVVVFTLLLLASCSNQVVKAFLQPGQAEEKQIPKIGKYNPCADFMNYAPDSLHPEYTPMRYIKVRFFIVKHDIKQALDFDLHKASVFVNTLIDEANSRISVNAKMVLPPGNNTPVLPINYRYVLYPDTSEPGDDGVKMIYDSLLGWGIHNVHGKNGLMDGKLYDKYGIQKGSVLNIFILEHNPDSLKSPTYRSGGEGYGNTQWIKLLGNFNKLPELKKESNGFEHYTGTNSMSAVMNHEMGHALGLRHSWDHDDCPDTPDNPNCWDQNSDACKQTGIFSNNMMDYNNQQSALTPCQIAHMQYRLANEVAQRKLLLPMWCQYKADSLVRITGDVIWNSAHDLEGDIIIGNNASLTIQCRVALPKGARIIIKPKGKLVIDGGEITNLCGDNWEGIEVWKMNKNSGTVVFINNPKITHAAHAVML